MPPSAQRSRIMRAIKGHGNRSTEGRFVAACRAGSLTGWRRNSRLLGRPDFMFRRERLAVFLDGCFWHGCPACYREPKSNVEFWRAKIARNRARDAAVTSSLPGLGWRVLRIWEHELRGVEWVSRLKAALSRD